MRKYLIGAAGAVIVVAAALGGAVGERMWGLLDKWLPRNNVQSSMFNVQKVLNEENVVIDVAERVSPSVVTVRIKKTQLFRQPIFDFFGQLGRTQERNIEQDIGTGFVIENDGLIATNKHVVGDTNAKYEVVTKDDKTYEVEKIYRDPANDLAILKINASGLKPVEMGDSSKLKVGQFVVAIGTALGEFRHTVTTGVVSGLGRGITAGSAFEGFAERLDDVIQTDAAINPGNSGGPLLNSAGQVVGVNTAVSSEGQNIGFAIPINVIKDAIDNFNKTGQFSRPFLGVKYRMIDLNTALRNEVPQGAYVEEVVKDSPAEKAGLESGDIITKIAGQKIARDDGSLAKIISGKKVGEKVEVEYWRDGETKIVGVTLEEAK
ncbi:MAG: Uncharacterized protein G01um101416_771 [Microgenomates group bacterium Gr01-1014_16]|nr:MAG: Uncharacterized protein G01um101416_771 [Microgenomates group bacterium Gr01-1014_16]